MRSCVRPLRCGASPAAGRYGNARTRSTSQSRARGSVSPTGFPDPDPIDRLPLRFADLLTPPDAPMTPRRSDRGRHRIPLSFCVVSMAQTDRVILSASAITTTGRGLRASHALAATPLRDRPADHGHGADDAPADITLAHFPDLAEELFAVGRPLPRPRPEPGREVTASAEAVRRRREGRDGQGADRAGPVVSRVWSAAALSSPPRPPRCEPRSQASQSCRSQGNLLEVHPPDLAHHWRRLGRRSVDRLLQPPDVHDALRRHAAVFGQMPAKPVDQLPALGHRPVAGAEDHCPGLLPFRLHGDKVHGPPRRRPTGGGARTVARSPLTASASTVSCFRRFTKALTKIGGSSRTTCPSFLISHPQ